MELALKCWLWFSCWLYRTVMHFTHIIPRMALGAIAAIFKKPWKTHSYTKKEDKPCGMIQMMF